MLEVLRLEQGRRSVLAVHAGNETVKLEPFTEVEIGLPALWGDAT